MKKLFAVVLSVLFVGALAVPALATDARQIALGGVGNYIEDDFNIFTWYGTLPSYSNTVWIGLDNYNDSYSMYTSAFMGASYGLGSEGKYGTLAMFFNEYGRPLNFGNWGWDGHWDRNYDKYSENPFADEYVSSKWNVLYGYAMEKLSFGLYFSRSDESDEYETSYDWTRPAIRDTAFDEMYATSYTTIGAGVRFDIGEKMYADLAFDYSWAGYTYNALGNSSDYYSDFGEISADANKMMNFRGRMFYEWNETITLVPYASFGNFDFSLKADSMKWYYGREWDVRQPDTLDWKDTHYGVKGMEFTLGIGANIKVNENNLLLFAVEPFSYQKLEQSDPPTGFVRYEGGFEGDDDPSWWGVTRESKSTILPAFRLALESDVRDWLTFRIGGVKTFNKHVYKESSTSQYGPDRKLDLLKVEETDTYIYSHFEYWMGLGFHVGDFDIDAVVDNSLPFRLGYWLTGYNNNQNAPVYMLSAAYHF